MSRARILRDQRAAEAPAHAGRRRQYTNIEAPDTISITTEAMMTVFPATPRIPNTAKMTASASNAIESVNMAILLL